MNKYSNFQELVDNMNDALSHQDPMVRVVELLGPGILKYKSFKAAMVAIERAFAEGRPAVYILATSHEESVRAVTEHRARWAHIRKMRDTRTPIPASRRLCVRAPRVAKTSRAGRARKTAASRTGPPGSSDDGDPEPGESGPNSHEIIKNETAKTRNGGCHV